LKLSKHQEGKVRIKASIRKESSPVQIMSQSKTQSINSHSTYSNKINPHLFVTDQIKEFYNNTSELITNKKAKSNNNLSKITSYLPVITIILKPKQSTKLTSIKTINQKKSKSTTSPDPLQESDKISIKISSPNKNLNDPKVFSITKIKPQSKPSFNPH
jgi:hypothetical protein